MIVSISQPAYLPWIGYFDRIARSDVHIVLDDVPLERGSTTRFTNRNRIKTPNGAMWLTIPVKTAGLGQPLIRDVVIDNEVQWRRKHMNAVKGNYSRAPFFEDHCSWLRKFFEAKWDSLASAIGVSNEYFFRALQISTPRILSSAMAATGAKSDYILNLCREVGATQYLSGPFGEDYLEAEKFAEAGIEIRFHRYGHPTYSQLHGGFVANLSVIDLLLNEGPRSAGIIGAADRGSR